MVEEVGRLSLHHSSTRTTDFPSTVASKPRTSSFRAMDTFSASTSLRMIVVPISGRVVQEAFYELDFLSRWLLYLEG